MKNNDNKTHASLVWATFSGLFSQLEVTAYRCLMSLEEVIHSSKMHLAFA